MAGLKVSMHIPNTLIGAAAGGIGAYATDNNILAGSAMGAVGGLGLSHYFARRHPASLVRYMKESEDTIEQGAKHLHDITGEGGSMMDSLRGAKNKLFGQKVESVHKPTLEEFTSGVDDAVAHARKGFDEHLATTGKKHYLEDDFMDFLQRRAGEVKAKANEYLGGPIKTSADMGRMVALYGDDVTELVMIADRLRKQKESRERAAMQGKTAGLKINVPDAVMTGSSLVGAAWGARKAAERAASEGRELGFLDGAEGLLAGAATGGMLVGLLPKGIMAMRKMPNIDQKIMGATYFAPATALGYSLYEGNDIDTALNDSMRVGLGTVIARNAYMGANMAYLGKQTSTKVTGAANMVPAATYLASRATDADHETAFQRAGMTQAALSMGTLARQQYLKGKAMGMAARGVN